MMVYGRAFVSMKIREMYKPMMPIEAMERPPRIQSDTITDAQPESSVPINRSTIR